MENKDGVYWDDRQRCWAWQVSGRKKTGYTSKRECAKDFVTHYVEAFPKYTPAIQGKTWRKIFKLFNIEVEE